MNTKKQGMSLVETIVGVAIFVLIFMTLFSSFQAILVFGERNRLRANALLLAQEHIEMIRALPFDSVGTVAGIPSGGIPQIETITYDNKTFTRRTFIQYVDDPADGLGAADSLAADYKRVKVEMKYIVDGAEQVFSLVTTVAPKSQESLVGAGVLRINITDALNNPISLATVHVLNNTIATSVDITTFTNASGTVSLPGAWEGAGYEIYVDKTGYSSQQTYTSTTTNPNPSPSPLNVLENATTEIFWKIDLLSSISLLTRSWPTRTTLADTFSDATQLTTLNNTQVVGDDLTLLGAPGTYSLSGNSASIPFTPTTLDSWLLFSFDNSVPANTSVSYQIEYDTGGGVFALIPNGDLPGNSAGFTTSPVDLGGLDTSTYTSLRVLTNLATTDINVTPQVSEYTLSCHEADNPIANVPFTLTGGKTIGTDALSAPIFKYDKSLQTDASGEWSETDMEYDTYDLVVSGYEIADDCPNLPIVLEPDTDLDEVVTLVSNTANNLKLTINDPVGDPVERAAVRIEGSVDDITRSTSACGTVYFPSLSAEDYTVSIEAPGLAPYSNTITVSGATEDALSLSF